ncbi:uncharacterized protein LOC143230323 isoform X2 [Tachypleus tridentatus]|uniref:uncharacterized protein LOC143230323 isoform X2 n=1 Tax=Tachypleus tridentatus TaxID=6853 RepID=UPI003FD49BFB
MTTNSDFNMTVDFSQRVSLQPLKISLTDLKATNLRRRLIYKSEVKVTLHPENEEGILSLPHHQQKFHLSRFGNTVNPSWPGKLDIIAFIVDNLRFEVRTHRLCSSSHFFVSVPLCVLLKEVHNKSPPINFTFGLTNVDQSTASGEISFSVTVENYSVIQTEQNFGENLAYCEIQCFSSSSSFPSRRQSIVTSEELPQSFSIDINQHITESAPSQSATFALCEKFHNRKNNENITVRNLWPHCSHKDDDKTDVVTTFSTPVQNYITCDQENVSRISSAESSTTVFNRKIITPFSVVTNSHNEMDSKKIRTLNSSNIISCKCENESAIKNQNVEESALPLSSMKCNQKTMQLVEPNLNKKYSEGEHDLTMMLASPSNELRIRTIFNNEDMSKSSPMSQEFSDTLYSPNKYFENRKLHIFDENYSTVPNLSQSKGSNLSSKNAKVACFMVNTLPSNKSVFENYQPDNCNIVAETSFDCCCNSSIGDTAHNEQPYNISDDMSKEIHKKIKSSQTTEGLSKIDHEYQHPCIFTDGISGMKHTKKHHSHFTDEEDKMEPKNQHLSHIAYGVCGMEHAYEHSSSFTREVHKVENEYPSPIFTGEVSKMKHEYQHHSNFSSAMTEKEEEYQHLCGSTDETLNGINKEKKAHKITDKVSMVLNKEKKPSVLVDGVPKKVYGYQQHSDLTEEITNKYQHSSCVTDAKADVVCEYNHSLRIIYETPEVINKYLYLSGSTKEESKVKHISCNPSSIINIKNTEVVEENQHFTNFTDEIAKDLNKYQHLSGIVDTGTSVVLGSSYPSSINDKRSTLLSENEKLCNVSVGKYKVVYTHKPSITTAQTFTLPRDHQKASCVSDATSSMVQECQCSLSFTSDASMMKNECNNFSNTTCTTFGMGMEYQETSDIIFKKNEGVSTTPYCSFNYLGNKMTSVVDTDTSSYECLDTSPNLEGKDYGNDVKLNSMKNCEYSPTSVATPSDSICESLDLPITNKSSCGLTERNHLPKRTVGIPTIDQHKHLSDFNQTTVQHNNGVSHNITDSEKITTLEELQNGNNLLKDTESVKECSGLFTNIGPSTSKATESYVYPITDLSAASSTKLDDEHVCVLTEHTKKKDTKISIYNTIPGASKSPISFQLMSEDDLRSTITSKEVLQYLKKTSHSNFATDSQVLRNFPRSISNISSSAEKKLRHTVFVTNENLKHNSLEKLPLHWEKKVDNHGRIFYVDHLKCKTTWSPPSSSDSTVDITEKIERQQLDLRYRSFSKYLKNHQCNQTAFRQEALRSLSKSVMPREELLQTPAMKFILQTDFSEALQTFDTEASGSSNSMSLHQKILQIKQDPRKLKKFHFDFELVNFINTFVDTELDLPDEWIANYDQFGKMPLKNLDNNSKKLVNLPLNESCERYNPPCSPSSSQVPCLADYNSNQRVVPFVSVNQVTNTDHVISDTIYFSSPTMLARSKEASSHRIFNRNHSYSAPISPAWNQNTKQHVSENTQSFDLLGIKDTTELQNFDLNQIVRLEDCSINSSENDRILVRNNRRSRRNLELSWTSNQSTQGHPVIPSFPATTEPLNESFATLTNSLSYNEKVVSFFSQPNIIEILMERHPLLREDSDLKAKVERIYHEGTVALDEFVDDIDIAILISLFEYEIMFYNSDNSVQTLSETQLSDRQEPVEHQELTNQPVQITKRKPTVLQRQGFADKLQKFYHKLKMKGLGQGSAELKLVVHREYFLADTITIILNASKKELQKNRLNISFIDEEGLDYGGPSRELFYLISSEIFNPYCGLFEYAANDCYTVQISPMSAFVDNHILLFRFCGYILGLALIHKYLLNAYFTRPFYKALLKLPCSIDDVQYTDPDFYQSMMWIKDNDISEASLDLTFSMTEEVAGKVEERELKPGGSGIVVTQKNKKDYIKRMIKWRLQRGVAKQTEALVGGFHEVLEPRVLKMFDAQDLEFVISGTIDIDIEDWKANTEYRCGYEKDHQVILWFWKAIENFDNQQRLRVLQFVTGTSRLPYEGFVALRGSNGPKKFCVQKWGQPTDLPRAHTCFNRLGLPPYLSFEVLQEKLLFASEECNMFGFE